MSPFPGEGHIYIYLCMSVRKLGGGVVWVLDFGVKVLGSIPAAATKFLGSFVLMGVYMHYLRFHLMLHEELPRFPLRN